MPRAFQRLCRRSSATRCRLGRVGQDADTANADFNAPYFHDGCYDTSGGREECSLARAFLKDLVLCLRRIDLTAAAGRYDDDPAEYADFRRLTSSAVPVALQNAEPWSLFNP